MAWVYIFTVRLRHQHRVIKCFGMWPADSTVLSHVANPYLLTVESLWVGVSLCSKIWWATYWAASCGWIGRFLKIPLPSLYGFHFLDQLSALFGRPLLYVLGETFCQYWLYLRVHPHSASECKLEQKSPWEACFLKVDVPPMILKQLFLPSNIFQRWHHQRRHRLVYIPV